MKKITIKNLQALKGQEPIAMITAYDALFAKIFESEVDVILVGDSLNMSFAGQDDTLTATIEQMIYHTKAVCNGAPSRYIITDMPFGSYLNKKQALENAVRVYQETKADAVKIEGGEEKAAIVKHLSKNGIAVVGHVGLMPQMARSEGGYSVKGKEEEAKEQILKDAQSIEAAGAVMLVIEGVRSDVATAVAEALTIPVIGIGAGHQVDGQVLVWSDMLGFFESFKPKFVKGYLEGATLVRKAVANYTKEVKNHTFPDKEHSYS